MTALTINSSGPVDQLEDRHLGMVEASGSSPDRSTPTLLFIDLDRGKSEFIICFLIFPHPSKLTPHPSLIDDSAFFYFHSPLLILFLYIE